MTPRAGGAPADRRPVAPVCGRDVFRPLRPYPFPYLGAAAPSPPHRPERPRPQTPDGLKGFAGRAERSGRTPPRTRSRQRAGGAVPVHHMPVAPFGSGEGSCIPTSDPPATTGGCTGTAPTPDAAGGA
ncbi:hypothetical protein C4B68_17940 [Streptomyces dengpaensis]|uniref:Uncharacterized protein n=1 Tax=Streptomyces dengpaensis TaxID=2049881 RepID=A0ABN5I354_9ACTN|nr:hypothetical protein C4B68_17940 [Streptomyces dengpaensis]